MFTQPCFIRRNTPELREKLEEIGYVSCCPFDSRCDAICVFERDSKPEYLDFQIDEDFEVNIKDSFPFVDAGTNEKLFLALAALRDDTWKNQWMVVPKIKIKRLSGYFPQMCGRDGHYMDVIGYDWTICQEPNIHQKIQSYIEDGEDEKFLPHKATVEEIIEHFKE